MALDASIYGNVRPVDFGSPLDSMGKALNLKQLALGVQQQELAQNQNKLVKQALTENMNPDGTVNQQGFLSALGKGGAPDMMLGYQEKFSKQNKDAADADAAAGNAYQQRGGILGHALGLVQHAPDEQKPQIYSFLRDQLIQGKVLKPGDIPETFNTDWLDKTLKMSQGTAGYLANQKTGAEAGHLKAETGKTLAETAYLPEKMRAEMAGQLYGARSPNAELTSQYDKNIDPIRKSQMNMSQMIDNYHNPSPQGDASLYLNALRIKFPNVPDVNSLEELKHIQSIPDDWKRAGEQAFKGGLDQPTRDNLLRDAISTYRANYDTYQGIKDRYDTRAKTQGVYEQSMTNEPGIEKAYKAAMALQDKLGPYVPPTEREGTFLGAVGKYLGSGNKSANASDKPPGKIDYGKLNNEDAAAVHWAENNKGDPRAQKILALHGGK